MTREHAAPSPIVKGATAALLMLALVNLLNYYDRMLVVVVSQPLRIEFGLTDTQFGLLSGPAFVFVYGAASLIFGYLADRRSRKKVIALSLAVWSLMTLWCGMAKSFPALALGRAGVGVGEGGANPAGFSLLSDYFPPQRRSLALAIFAAGGMVGLFLSFMLGSWISVHYGWRMVFLIAAIPGILAALLVLVVLREPVRGQFERSAVTQSGYLDGLGKLMRNKAYVWLCIGASWGVFSSLGMLIWLPQFFIRSHHMTLPEVGFLFGPAAALGLCAGMILGGWLGDRMARQSLERPVLICVVANLILAPLYMLVLWLPSTPVALAVTFIAMAVAVVYAPAVQAATQTVLTPDIRASGAAWFNVNNAIIGQGLIPFFVGVLSDYFMSEYGAESLRYALSIASLLTILSGLFFLRALALTRDHHAVGHAVRDSA